MGILSAAALSGLRIWVRLQIGPPPKCNLPIRRRSTSRPMTPRMFGGPRHGDTIRRCFIRATDMGSAPESTSDCASAAGAAGVLAAGDGARTGSAAAYSSTPAFSIAMDSAVTVMAADSEGDRGGRPILVLGWG